MQKQNQFTLKAGNLQKQTINIRADWSKAKISNNGTISVVETQIQAMGQFGFVTTESMYASEITKNEDYKYSMSRLVVIKHKKTGEIYSFIMSIAGDRNYLENKKFQLWDNTYLKRDKDLSAIVLFHSLAGNFINGWVYCDGTIINSITDAKDMDIPIQLKSTAEMQMEIYEWVQTCTDYYDIGIVGNSVVSVSYSRTSCNCRLVHVGSYTVGTTNSSVAGGISDAYHPTRLPCDCPECPVCGKCLEMLKNAIMDPVYGEGSTTTTVGCEMCGGHPVPLPVVDATDLLNNLKANCIYQKLLNGGILSSFISRYFGITQQNQSYLGELNLTWTLGSSTETLPIGIPRNGTYSSVEIRLNENALNSNSASNGALSMLHEALHAKLIAEYYDNTGSTDFKKLYAYYKGWGTGNIDSQQETVMLNTYSNDMASALQSFDQSQGIYHSLTFYTEAVKCDLANNIFYTGYYQSGIDELAALRNSSIHRN